MVFAGVIFSVLTTGEQICNQWSLDTIQDPVGSEAVHSMILMVLN